MFDRASTIADFLTATAAKQPTPGGGSIAAVAGALAAAIGEMVLAYSVDKKDLAGHRPELLKIAGILSAARDELLEDVVEDQSVFERLTAARKLTADDPTRAGRIRAAVEDCIICPQNIGMAALTILQQCDRAVPIVNRFLLSDLAVSAELAMATVRCAAYNIRANLSSLDTDAERAETVALTDQMLASGLKLIQRIIPAVWARVDAR